jgi:hypothetical protein
MFLIYTHAPTCTHTLTRCFVQCSFWLEIKAELEDASDDDAPLLATFPVNDSAGDSGLGGGNGADGGGGSKGRIVSASEGKKKVSLQLDTKVSQKLPTEVMDATHTLCVEVASANELMDTSMGVTAQDPYVTVSLLPNKYQLQRTKPLVWSTQTQSAEHRPGGCTQV